MMMHRITLIKTVAVSFLPILIFCSKLSAQKQDSVASHHLLIIPFQPDYYLSDSEQEIMSQSRKTPDEYRAYFRRTLDLKITAALENIISCTSLLYDTSGFSQKNLKRYYEKAALAYSAPVNAGSAKEKPEKISKEMEDQHRAPQYLSVKGDSKFMNATVRDSVFLHALMNAYGSDLLLSINQFEIRTNYKSCIDIANKIYKRELLVDYSLINSNGKVISGNSIVVFFPSDTNRDSDIAERVFPNIASSLKNTLVSVISSSK